MFAGIVLAGGGARRLGGVDKPMLEVGGRPLLARSVAALDGAEPVVVVGPRRDGVDGVRWARENPPGGGPVAALAAGLELIGTAEFAGLLAGDLTGITKSTVDRLRAAVGAADGALLLDGEGHRQWLAGVWRAEALRSVLPDDPAGQGLGRVLRQLSFVEVSANSGETADVDTPEDLDRARDLA